VSSSALPPGWAWSADIDEQHGLTLAIFEPAVPRSRIPMPTECTDRGVRAAWLTLLAASWAVREAEQEVTP
jgi:hypothetical protein